MFDRIVVDRRRVEHVPYVKEVREIKAPTEESVKLLREMEEAVVKRILDRFVCEDNIINFKAFLYETPMTLGFEWEFCVTINGRDYWGRFPVKSQSSRLELITEVRRKAVEMIVAQMAVDKAGEIR